MASKNHSYTSVKRTCNLVPVRRQMSIALFLAISWCIIITFSSCKTYHRNSTHADIPLSSIKKGEELSKIYCGSCHKLPDPSLLDSKTWETGVLPQMGPRLGIFNYGFDKYPMERGKNIDPDYYPAKQIIGFTEWQNILDYYIATSPDSLPPQKRNEAISKSLSLFQVQLPQIDYVKSATCYAKINVQDTLHPIIISDALKQNIYFINRKLQITDSVTGTGPVVDIDFNKNSLLACDIGILNPNNGKFGKGVLVNINTKGQYQKDTIPFIDSLQRPVQITPADLNHDGKMDYIVCEFGYLAGQLSWLENLGNNKFQKHILRNTPGAIKVYVQDYNHDRLPDIWALFAQAEEGIFLFTNKGKGNFGQEQVLRFPPSFGSSYFELDDFNNDGYPDIVYTCGDNADFSPVLKPYHGVYIFMNDGANNFAQKYFFPINGCYKAMARDFDNDGDLDIAAISFFADYAHQPEEGFVYLKNTGSFNFLPYSVPGTETGRWLTMDAGDIDRDGKTDIILGNFSVGPASSKPAIGWKKGLPFMVLKNIIK